jgi:hypothetical protein
MQHNSRLSAKKDKNDIRVAKNAVDHRSENHHGYDWEWQPIRFSDFQK